MKKLITLSLLFVSISAFAQNSHLVEITLDGKPAILNTETGETTYANSNSTTVSQSVVTNNSDIIDTHQVQRGETLYSISKKYAVSMAQIKTVNNLDNNVLSVGQVLNIGYASTTQMGNTSDWIVAKGDTLYAISKQSGVSVSEIKRLNNLDTTIISIGQKLRLK